ncbi:SRPBCC domain-containing protein [Modestobacter sp. I12A-02628]|uniref:SRPBCC domain-containing protein n=1 Tax=Goekera deserti TaxID=2497753 RepID=A0A7K3W900_9ACTN|nr:SRPBCC domain-containing protein [Goekera deserti]MPQ98648.1 SRPBCC domain-containing protein [Goekera deserti]NDI49210.1 SRPBCC domain-containing protein [Goekera deserti]NEL52948.1 SRPBCC domain-containing protein [Goekera deserti]
MTVNSVEKDLDSRTMTITAHFDAPVERVWQVWSDPRQLERWWGPPTYPASFTEHDLSPGGRAAYSMTGPEGDRHHGWWRFTAVDAPHRIELEDGFADDQGRPTDGLPSMTMLVTLTEQAGGGTTMAIRTTFPSSEAMEQMVAMGMDEGMRAAMGQIDDVLASAVTS